MQIQTKNDKSGKAKNINLANILGIPRKIDSK